MKLPDDLMITFSANVKKTSQALVHRDVCDVCRRKSEPPPFSPPSVWAEVERSNPLLAQQPR